MFLEQSSCMQTYSTFLINLSFYFFTNSMTNAPCYCTAERALLTLLVTGHLSPPAPCFDPDTNCRSLKLFARLLHTPNAPVTCSFY